MILTVPWPPEECGRNYQRRHHWSKYRKPVARYRHDCWVLALEAKAKGLITRVEFRPPNLRSDDDNIISAFKSGRDGIADALKVNDNKFRPVYVIGDPSRPNGKILVTIEEA